MTIISPLKRAKKGVSVKILITGGAGYIGSHLVKQLGEESDHEITVLDNLSTGFRDSVLYGEFIQADLSDFDKIDKIVKEGNFDAVIHFAASLVVPESVTDPLKYYLNNTANTANLIRSCIKHKVNRFIFSSTAAVYGEKKGEEIKVKENDYLSPLNPYGMSKLMSETILKDAAKAHKDFKFVILRYFNVAGAAIDGKIGQKTKDSTVLIKVCAETAAGKRDRMYIFGNDYPTPDGTCIRDYIHVEDLCYAHTKALEYLNEGGESDVFNCGYGRGYSVKEVVDTMKRVSGNDFEVRIKERRAGDPSAVIANANKIRNVLGWNPRYNDLDLICKTAYEWEMKNALAMSA